MSHVDSIFRISYYLSKPLFIEHIWLCGTMTAKAMRLHSGHLLGYLGIGPTQSLFSVPCWYVCICMDEVSLSRIFMIKERLVPISLDHFPLGPCFDFGGVF